jgi:hypothetical protein
MTDDQRAEALEKFMATQADLKRASLWRHAVRSVLWWVVPFALLIGLGMDVDHALRAACVPLSVSVMIGLLAASVLSMAQGATWLWVSMLAAPSGDQ